MIYFNGNKLNKYTILDDGKPTSVYASKELKKYISLACGDFETDDLLKFYVATTDSDDDEHFCIKNEENNLSVTGGKRGVIYGIYEFLTEYCGFGFYAENFEVIPKLIDKICLPNRIFNEQTSGLKFREIGVNNINNTDTLLKFRFNSNAWSYELSEEVGGGYSYAGIPVHSMTGAYLLKDYVETNPELFALVDGKRLTDRMGQVCFSAKNLVPVLIKEVLKVLDENPTANFVSLTEGDNQNFCQCDECKKLYEQYSLTEIFINIINQVARVVKEKYPKVLVHTCGYHATMFPPQKEGLKYDENVIYQYAVGRCKNHAYDDPACSWNQETYNNFKNWTKKVDHFFVWDYTNCFYYQMINMPEIQNLRKNYKFFADYNSFGIFNESVHKRDDDTMEDTTCFIDLKTYLHSKLMWNPYMSEEEFNKHYLRFMSNYYGASYPYLMEYISLYESSINPEFHGSWHPKRQYFSDEFILPENKANFIQKAEKLWNKAIEVSEPAFIEKVKKEHVQFLYLKQILIFDDVMANGTDVQKAKLLEDNKKLIDLILKYKLKITFYGMTIEEHAEYLPRYYNVSPKEWNYSWNFQGW